MAPFSSSLPLSHICPCARPLSSLHYLEGPEWQARRRGRLSFPRPPLVRADRQVACAAALVLRCYLHVLARAQQAGKVRRSRGMQGRALVGPAVFEPQPPTCCMRGFTTSFEAPQKALVRPSVLE